jgi:crotonobetainyl-CoA:carnitine CoA-transferase CaiB-like acyl-CoA transferase
MHPTVGTFPALGLPLKFAGFDDPEIGRPPLLGEHTDEVLSSMLGLSAAEIAALREEGAI